MSAAKPLLTQLGYHLNAKYTMKLSTFKELCESWEIEDDCEIKFGIDGKVYEAESFFFVNNTIILNKGDDPSSDNK